jgi:glycosyltransferase involved in cell wall biosynthesis
MPFFSVIVPTHNRLVFLQQTLESIWAQRFTDFEVIVVDDGSTDGTREWLGMHAKRAHVITQANRGPSTARNAGAKSARGEYLAFLDSDDLWFPWTLDIYREVIEQWRKPAFIAGKPFRFWADTELNAVARDKATSEFFPDYLASGSEWRWWGISSFVVRTDAFNSAGGFASEINTSEDADLALRLGDAQGFVQVTAPFTFAYREHASNLSGTVQRDSRSGFQSGIDWLLKQEQRGIYPGGKKRARERWAIISRHVRPVALAYLRHGRKKEAWELYRATFRWNLQLRRWKFLAGFPLSACLNR